MYVWRWGEREAKVLVMEKRISGHTKAKIFRELDKLANGFDEKIHL